MQSVIPTKDAFAPAKEVTIIGTVLKIKPQGSRNNNQNFLTNRLSSTPVVQNSSLVSAEDLVSRRI